MRERKRQTPAQLVANSAWLRHQIAEIIRDCGESIAEDRTRANTERDARRRDAYLARAESHEHWKRQLERILRGKTFADELIESLKWSPP